ncbi:MAG: M28 family peptidase [Ardenticatenales bacterium]|nr:M28 family peptidase [Ardenticatenales bacterium]
MPIIDDVRTPRPTAPLPVRRRLAARSAALAAAAALAVSGGCRGAPAPDERAESTAASVVAGTAEAPLAPGALPTYTLGPPGVMGLATAGSADGSSVAPGGGGNAPPSNGNPPPAEGLPAPTPRPSEAVAAAGPPPTDPAIVDLMGAVSADRLRADVVKLASLGTRHALSSPEGGARGVGPARQWLRERFEQIGRSSVSQIVAQAEPFPLTFAGRSTEQQNVVATLTGIGRDKRFVYVIAHYDSRTSALDDGASDAPGASDNASGTAALLELARVMGRRQWDATVRLLATAAKEEGQFGAKHHAAHARELGLGIVAVLNNDVVGGAAGAGGARQPASVRAFSAGADGGPSRRLARYAAVVAARYAGALGAPAGPLAVEAVPTADVDAEGGDHMAFTEAGYPAIRLMDAIEDAGRRHAVSDTAERLDPAYQAAVVRLNVAVAANLALAPVGEVAAPRLVVEAVAAGTAAGATESPGGDRLRVTWDALPNPDVKGYYVAWRLAGEPAYRAVQWSRGTETVINGVPVGAEVRVAVAGSDDLGHMGVFGGEGVR